MKNTSTEKIAVVLFNLGGPLKEADIKPFLFNFFMDKNIIAAPLPIRAMIAALIAWRRGNGAAKESYQRLGGKSPLLENTKAQACALEKKLCETHPSSRVFVSMRYWHPMADAVMRDVLSFHPDRVVLLPLYPQYSTTTSFSSLQNWRQTAEKMKAVFKKQVVCCYPDNDGFIDASADLIREQLQKAPKKIRLLFSAHGLPEKIIEGGDPYQHQCERTAQAIVTKLGVENLDWQLCYQSRVGPLKWIGPSTEEAIEKAATDNVGVVIYPLAFVSEHVETLVELDIEGREMATRIGIPYYARVKTVSTHPDFIEGLHGLVISALSGLECGKICQDKFSRCYCREAAYA